MHTLSPTHGICRGDVLNVALNGARHVTPAYSILVFSSPSYLYSSAYFPAHSAAVTYCLVICKGGHDGCYVHSTVITVSAILFIVEHVFWSPSYHLSFPVSCFTPISPLPYPPASPLLSHISFPSLSLSPSLLSFS